MITLTTDFGYKDPFVGMMKGVILGINPSANIVDITHGIGPQNIMEAAITIGDSYRYFPPDSIHVVVVDPGVGSGRRPIIVKAADQIFIGPDNGVFSLIYKEYDNPPVLHITASHHFLHSPGNTFHGRDVFAPVASWLSRGTRPENLGDPITDYVKLDMPGPKRSGGEIAGEVIYIDGFGNAITNVLKEDMDSLCKNLTVSVKGERLDILGYYEEGPDGKPHSLINSNGRLEVFIYMADASAALDLRLGDVVKVHSGQSL